ncbi:hypothetical protein BaRGS_00022124 [Batillaria attramentaria]|uniref:Uncharacterized protein n=1 Tax=Batillaria attramentaria TaxID=370345 RepID=A0ABD0KHG7_9CAEN
MAVNGAEVKVKTEPVDDEELPPTTVLSETVGLTTITTTATSKKPTAATPPTTSQAGTVMSGEAAIPSATPVTTARPSVTPTSATLQIMSDGGLRVVTKNPACTSGFPTKSKTPVSTTRPQQYFFVKRGTDGQLQLLMTPASQPNRFFLLRPSGGGRFQLGPSQTAGRSSTGLQFAAPGAQTSTDSVSGTTNRFPVPAAVQQTLHNPRSLLSGSSCLTHARKGTTSSVEDDTDLDGSLPVFFGPQTKTKKKKKKAALLLAEAIRSNSSEKTNEETQCPATDTQANDEGADSDDGAFPFRIDSVFSLSSEEPASDFPSLVEPKTENDPEVITIKEEYNSSSSSQPLTQEEMLEKCGSSFVVLERLSEKDMDEKGNLRGQSRCSDYCRKRTLNYLCMLDLILCHPLKKRRIKIEDDAGFQVKEETDREDFKAVESAKIDKDVKDKKLLADRKAVEKELKTQSTVKTESVDTADSDSGSSFGGKTCKTKTTRPELVKLCPSLGTAPSSTLASTASTVAHASSAAPAFTVYPSLLTSSSYIVVDSKGAKVPHASTLAKQPPLPELSLESPELGNALPPKPLSESERSQLSIRPTKLSPVTAESSPATSANSLMSLRSMFTEPNTVKSHTKAQTLSSTFPVLIEKILAPPAVDSAASAGQKPAAEQVSSPPSLSVGGGKPTVRDVESSERDRSVTGRDTVDGETLSAQANDTHDNHSDTADALPSDLGGFTIISPFCDVDTDSTKLSPKPASGVSQSSPETVPTSSCPSTTGVLLQTGSPNASSLSDAGTPLHVVSEPGQTPATSAPTSRKMVKIGSRPAPNGTGEKIPVVITASPVAAPSSKTPAPKTVSVITLPLPVVTSSSVSTPTSVPVSEVSKKQFPTIIKLPPPGATTPPVTKLVAPCVAKPAPSVSAGSSSQPQNIIVKYVPAPLVLGTSAAPGLKQSSAVTSVVSSLAAQKMTSLSPKPVPVSATKMPLELVIPKSVLSPPVASHQSASNKSPPAPPITRSSIKIVSAASLATTSHTTSLLKPTPLTIPPQTIPTLVFVGNVPPKTGTGAQGHAPRMTFVMAPLASTSSSTSTNTASQSLLVPTSLPLKAHPSAADGAKIVVPSVATAPTASQLLLSTSTGKQALAKQPGNVPHLDDLTGTTASTPPSSRSQSSVSLLTRRLLSDPVSTASALPPTSPTPGKPAGKIIQVLPALTLASASASNQVSTSASGRTVSLLTLGAPPQKAKLAHTLLNVALTSAATGTSHSTRTDVLADSSGKSKESLVVSPPQPVAIASAGKAPRTSAGPFYTIFMPADQLKSTVSGAKTAPSVTSTLPKYAVSLLPPHPITSSVAPQPVAVMTPASTDAGSRSAEVLSLLSKLAKSSQPKQAVSTVSATIDAQSEPVTTNSGKRAATNADESATKEDEASKKAFVRTKTKRKKYAMPPDVVIKTEPASQGYPGCNDVTTSISAGVTSSANQTQTFTSVSNSGKSTDSRLAVSILNGRRTNQDGLDGELSPTLEPECDVAPRKDVRDSPVYDEPPVLTPIYPLSSENRKRKRTPTPKSRRLSADEPAAQQPPTQEDPPPPPLPSLTCPSPTPSSSGTSSVTSPVSSAASTSASTHRASSSSSSSSASSERIRQLKAMLLQQNEQLEQIRKQRAGRGPLLLND